MKFLIIAKDRQGITPLDVRQERLPSEQLRQHIISGLDQIRGWLQEKKASGNIDMMYGFVGGGGAAIANYEDHDKLNADLRISPLSTLVEWEVIPLCDFNKHIEVTKRIFEAAGKLA